jgi:neutral ceramidase
MIRGRHRPAPTTLILFALCITGASQAASGRVLPAPPAGSALRVGYGKADITPELGTPCALGLDDELLEVFDPLYIRAVWLESGGKTVLILTGDVIGVNGSDSDEFSALVEKAVGVPRKDILITSTHTHQTANSRWDVGELLRPFGLEEQFVSLKFKDQYVRGLLEAARQAKASAVPCEMAYAEFPVKDIASNRRIPIGGGKVEFRSSRAAADMRAKPEGKIDPLLRAVFFRSLKDGATIGIVNYNCHPTAAGGEEVGYATGDFPGVGMTMAEEKMGNLKLLHLTGTAGEINPGKYVVSDSPAAADRKREVRLMGERYAQAILGAAGRVKSWAPATELELSRESFGLTLQDKIAPLEEVRKKLAAAAEEYKKKKAEGNPQPGRMRGLSEEYVIFHSKDGKLMTQAAALRVGDIFFTFMPGEDMLKLGEEVRDHFGRPRLLNVTLALDCGTSYIVPQVYFDEGGYEPTATRLAPAAYVELREKMVSLLKSVGLAAGKPWA